jgi:hypothetical protein
MRLAGIPIESKFYLVGNAVIARGLFEYTGASRAGRSRAHAFLSGTGSRPGSTWTVSCHFLANSQR